MRSLGVCVVAQKHVCVGVSTHDVVCAVWLQGCRAQQLVRGRLSNNGCFLTIGLSVV